MRLLAPFLRIMKRSPRFTVEIAQHGFVLVLLELLKKQHAEAQRKLERQRMRCGSGHRHPG